MRTRLMLLSVVILAGAAALATSTAARPAPLATENYKIDPVHSFSMFRVKHLNVGYVYGRFNDIGGTFTVDKESPDNVKFDVTIKTASIDTNNKGRDDHLRKPEFFDAEKHPTMTFKSTKVAASGENSYEAVGDFTLKGVTKPLTVTIDLVGSGPGMQGEHRAGYETKFTIKRSEFGVSALPGGVGDEVTIVVAMEGVRQ